MWEVSDAREEEAYQEGRNQQAEEEVAAVMAEGAAPANSGGQGSESEEPMPKAICPVCSESLVLGDEEAVLYEQVTCPNCGAELEVIDEDPVILDEVLEE